MKKSLLSLSAILILGVILLFINGISDALFGRFFLDLTEERLYSLSDGSINIIKAVQEPVTLKFYYSKTDGSKYPAVKLYGQRVLDLLREYERQSSGKLNLEVYDPRPDSEEEEWAQKYGLAPMQIPTGESLFLGLAAVSSLGAEDSIPVFDLSRQELLEYDISKLIYSVRSAKKPVVGIISSLNVKGSNNQQQPSLPGRSPQNQEQPWILLSQLSNFAEVKVLSSTTESIGDDINVLMVLHPKNLSEKTIYAIDQYAVKGGSVFIAIDPFCGSDKVQADPENPMSQLSANRSSNLKDLLSAWGVSMNESKVVGDINLATKVTLAQGAPAETFLLWLSLGSQIDSQGSVINKDDIVTAQLSNVMLAWSGALDISQKEGITSEVLFRSTSDAMLYDTSDVKMFGDNPQEVLKKYKRGDKSQVLAVRLRGKLKSSFANKPGVSQEQSNMSIPTDHIAQGEKESSVVIISDVDFLADQYSAISQKFFGTQLVQLLNDNLVFGANIIENLSGSSDLISLRSRGRFMRPFTKVNDIEIRAQQKWQQEETALQAKLNETNQRLSQLQAGEKSEAKGKSVVSQAVLEEIKKFRKQRQDAQQSLREVRRKLREDKERLGNWLFVINTFGVATILIIISIWHYLKLKNKNK